MSIKTQTMKKEINKTNKELNVKFLNLESTPTIVNYIMQKIDKPKFTGLKLNEPNVSIKKDVDSGPKKYVVSVSLVIHNIRLYFREAGDNLYALVDAIIAKINRKIAKFKATMHHNNYKNLYIA